jgi:glutamate synthase (NADPH/NADH) large chain
VVDEYFTGTVSRLGGIGLDVIAEEVLARHRAAYPTAEVAHRCWRPAASTSGAGGRVPPVQPGDRPSCSTPPAPAATPIFKEYTTLVDDQSEQALATLRGLFDFKPTTAMPLDEVESVAEHRQALQHRRDELRLDLARRRTRPWPSR